MKKATHDTSSKLYDYLGHFKKDEYLCKGHNDSGKIELPFDKSEMEKFSQGFDASTKTKPDKPNPQASQPKEEKRILMNLREPSSSTGQAY